MKHVVHFGAGNIGRGFIGELFFKNNYHIYFADVATNLVNKLKETTSYTIKTASDEATTTVINDFTCLHSISEKEELLEAIGKATFITTAVGATILPKIAPIIAEGIIKRNTIDYGPLHIIACENQINATSKLEADVKQLINPIEWGNVSRQIYFHNCAVDRIIPDQNNDGLLDLVVDPYFEWIVENPYNVTLPPIAGMEIVKNIAPYIERKLFTVNTGHAATAYLGFVKQKRMIAEALQDEFIYKTIYAVLQETKQYLHLKYPIDDVEHDQYIKKILKRFQNIHLQDDVTRVGRSPIRKLHPEERLIKPAQALIQNGQAAENLISIITAALNFNVTSDPEAVELQNMLSNKGINYVLENICQLSPDDKLYKKVLNRSSRN